MRADPWRPEQYLRYRKEREQPFFDLLELVHPRSGMRVVDLGCGTGALTAELHRRLEARETIGVDASPAMLGAATSPTPETLRFIKEDIQNFIGDGANGDFDLVFSNAALHWVPDHRRLFARMTDTLVLEGQLAVQVPANFDHISHTTASEVAQEDPFVEALEGYTHPVFVLQPEEYASLLNGLGYRRQHVRLQVYGHHLPGREDVVEWLKGSLLTVYERRLPEDLFAAFRDRYRRKVLSRLEDSRPFYFTFKRILIWAER
jgi:trans-aconitate 2-methyltransferase